MVYPVSEIIHNLNLDGGKTMNQTTNARPKIAIIGAGFGGLWAARKLAAADVDVTLIDRNNYHVFLPLLYQVAAAEIEPEQIAYPVRSILRQHPNVNFMMAEVTGVDFADKTVQTSVNDVQYDCLIMAMGSRQHFFNVPGAAAHAIALKTVNDATAIRHKILSYFELAVNEPDAAKRRALLTFAIVGGGPAGVEFAGALRELINRPMQRDYPRLDFADVRVILIEATDEILNAYTDKQSDYALGRMHDMGVEVMLNTRVDEVFADGVQLSDGTWLPTHTVVWTAGVEGETLPAGWEVETKGLGQVDVLPTLQTTTNDDVFAIGDMAYVEAGGRPIPMVAQKAMQEGEHAAVNVLHLVNGTAPTPFVYKDLGMMATIGRNSAIASFGRFHLTGFIAWLMWLVIHIVNLIGFRNRLVVLINWAWDYFFFERVARLILTKEGTRQ